MKHDEWRELFLNEERSKKQPAKGNEVVEGIVGLLFMALIVVGVAGWVFGDFGGDDDRCDQISADVDAGRYPVSGWESDEGATETEMNWWIENCSDSEDS